MLVWKIHRGHSLRVIFPCLVIFSTLLVVPTSIIAQDPSLELTAQPPARGSEVRFVAKPSGVVSAASLGDSSLVPSAKTAHGFVVEVDSASFRQDKNHRYVMDVYVPLRADEPDGSLYKFLVWEDQAGKFSDGWANVSVVISSHGTSESTSLRLPLHCTDSDNLQIDISKPITVGMGSNSTRTLGIKNALSDLHVAVQSVNGVTVEDRNCPLCWSSLKGSVPRLNLAQGAGTTLDIDFQPNTMLLLKQNFWPPAADAPPYVLTVSVVSTAEKGGFDVSQEFSVPIRFTPAPLHIAFSLIFGVIVGLTLRALISRKVDWLDFSFQFLIAIIVWLLLLITKSKASMFGYDLDPTSLVAAGVVALVVAGGAPVGEKIAGAIRGVKP